MFALKPGTETAYQEYKDKNTDAYGNAVVEFGERWGDAMEAAMAGGEPLSSCWERLSMETADGITGFMYGCGVQALAHFWVHGDDLRKLHNGSYGVSEDKAGVVNPAILTINV